MSWRHVPLPRALQLPLAYRFVESYLQRFDPDLRLRRSVERPSLYVLERRCRRRPAANLGMRDLSDMHVQARDGYIHVATVHPSFLNKPWHIVRELREGGADLWADGGFAKVADELRYEEEWARETRRRRRRQHFREIAREGFDLLDRRGNGDGTERTRISSAGLPAPA